VQCSAVHSAWESVVFICRAIVQTVSRQFPTAAEQVLSQVRLCGICGE
jgi:hypothetical protein